MCCFVVIDGFIPIKRESYFLSLSIRCITFVFTLLVLLSRVYLRDHFPTDTLASLSLDFSSYYLLLAFIG
uniref:phosphatase PAP2 family protein n=1 Tax=Streptococcus uberis TaxID=1349 RepID=UPI003CCFE187